MKTQNIYLLINLLLIIPTSYLSAAAESAEKFALSLAFHQTELPFYFSPEQLISEGTRHTPQAIADYFEEKKENNRPIYFNTAEKIDVPTIPLKEQIINIANAPISIAVVPNSNNIAATVYSSTVIYDAENGKPLKSFFRHDDFNVISSIAFSPDGQYLASASHDKTIRIWDISDIINVENVVAATRKNPCDSCVIS